MIYRILFYFCIFFFIHILPSWNYEFESCCLNEKTLNNTTRLLSCPLNFVIKLRSVIFYTGNGCARSACQKRFNKHYLPCNNHRTCSISIQCILMDSSTCPWLTKVNSHSQHIIVDYDCILYKPELPSITLDNKMKKDMKNENVVLFSAKVNIESPPDLFNDSISTDDENAWKEYFFKKYFHNKQLPDDDKTIIIHQRSLFNDILRTVIILIIFASVLILLMISALVVYKRITLIKRRKLYEQEKQQPFPADDAYDNLKATTAESASDSGTTTDV
ncbi:unnamed protein product [Adineta steineri]|uniref:Uncharacterized protein n=1 Tax=Adineta steineri TaxID=433720 RepID=A0A818QTS9_9BILA|nr:unnamed protein product [Adineta steineri]CAF0941729.1 unnamed protein product [Adineta steineri]CAF0958383.1 unnamed protein product [Adineta steineri]CAF3580951.1 unnamed protein product [Adineta steineri]CAF3641973.1 unnamed protein product [Adineta steineri]